LASAHFHQVNTRSRGDVAIVASTAVFVAFDKGGGYWDSGYIQPLDFFGDGPRIPFIVLSPFSRGTRGAYLL